MNDCAVLVPTRIELIPGRNLSVGRFTSYFRLARPMRIAAQLRVLQILMLWSRKQLGGPVLPPR